MYLQKFVYLLPCAGDESVLFGNTLLNVREDEESRAMMTLPGDEGPVAEFTHKGLDSSHISFALPDTTRNALVMVKESTDHHPLMNN